MTTTPDVKKAAQTGDHSRKSPFQGLRAYTKADRDWFFGRDNETDEIISLILGHKLVLVYAQSGAGKTSFLNAKIVPELEENGLHVLPVTRVGSTFLDKSLVPSNAYMFNALQNMIANTINNNNPTLSAYSD